MTVRLTGEHAADASKGMRDVFLPGEEAYSLLVAHPGEEDSVSLSQASGPSLLKSHVRMHTLLPGLKRAK
jgi:hypothetical protein